MNYIFDLFGTLVTNDKEGKYKEVLKDLFPEIDEKDLLGKLGTKRGAPDEVLSKVAEELGLNIDDSRKQKILDTLNTWVDAQELNPNVESTLQRLKQNGSTLGIISNCNVILEPVIQRLGLQKYFDVIVLSHKFGQRKPAMAIYHYCVEEMEVELGEVTMVGDNWEKDVLKPIQLGMKGIFYDPKNEHPDKTPRVDDFKKLR